MRSTITKLIGLAALLLPCLAHSQINPGNQINWPTGCTSGLVYSPASNTCVSAGGGSNEVQYNDPDTAYVWMADSSIGSDDHAISATISVTSSSYVGSGSATTVTFTNSGSNGLAALQTQFGTAWIDTQGLTSPSFLNTGNCITSYNMAATGVCIFPVTVIDSTHFSISYPTNEGSGSGTSGTVYTANWYLPIYVQNTQPYFNGHGIVAEKTQIIYTASLTSTFTADFAALAPVNTGHPGWIIHSNDQDVYFTASTGSCTAAAIEGYYQNVWAQAHALGYKWAEATTRAGSQNTSVSACSGATGIWQTVENWKRQQKCNASGAPAQTQCFDALIDQWGITGGEQSNPYQTGGRLTYAGIALLASKFNDAMVAQGSPSPTMVEGLIPNGGGWDVNTYNVSGSAFRIGLNFAYDFTWDTNAHSSWSPIVGFSGFGGGNPPTSGQMAYTTSHTLLFNDNGTIRNVLFPATGLSGMTAGQVPIAATATTATSSEALAGAGAGLTTGPVSATTANDVVTMNGTNGQIKDSGTLITALAPIVSPTFTGVPAAPTATGGTSTTQLATTAFVQAAIAAAGTGAGIVTYSGPSITFTGTQYFPIGGGATSSTTETNVDIDAPAAVTIQNMTVQMSAAPGIGNSVVYTWRKNASGTVLTCTISGSSATSCSDTTHNFSTAALDLLDIQAVTTGTIVGTPTVVMAAQVGVGVTGSVASFSGDGALLSNSASTGPVTAALANAAANTVWGNETGGSTTPSYGKLALPTIATQAADTLDMNASGSTASPTAVAMPTCTGGADLYNTSTHSWSCVSTGAAPSILTVPPSSGSFTFVNQGSATVASGNFSTLNLLSGNDAVTAQFHLLSQTNAFSTPYSIWTAFSATQGGAANEASAIGLTDGTKWILMEIFNSSSSVINITIERWTNPTTFSSTVLSATALTAPNSFRVQLPQLGTTYFRWRNDGTNLFADVSPNGVIWQQVYTEAVGTFLTPTGYGLGARSNANSSTTFIMNLVGWQAFNNATL